MIYIGLAAVKKRTKQIGISVSNSGIFFWQEKMLAGWCVCVWVVG